MSKRSKRSGGGRKNKSAGQSGQSSFEGAASSSRGNGAQLAASSQGVGRKKPFKEQALDQLDGARSAMRSQVQELGSTVQTELQSELAGAKKIARAAGERIQQVAQTAQRGLQTAGRGLGDTVRENPLPIAMAGIGLSWLAISLIRGTSSGSSAGSSSEDNGSARSRAQGGALDGALNQAKRAAGSVGESTSALVQGARASVDGLTQGASEKLGQLTAGVQEQGRRVGTYIKQTADERPLWLGAAAIATGAALGFALPSTRRENLWFGSARDKAMDQVESLARDAMDKVENRVEGAAQFLGIGDSGSSGSSGGSTGGKRGSSGEQAPRGRKQAAQA